MVVRSIPLDGGIRAMVGRVCLRGGGRYRRLEHYIPPLESQESPMPTVLPVDLTAIVAIVMGMLTVLIPIAGLTARFALKPVVESLARLFDSRTVEDTVEITERRVALLEQQIESLEDTVKRLQEERDFDRELQAGSRASGELPPPGP